jgi:ribonuclease E
MAKSVDVAKSATSPITDDQLDRVREFAREPILLDGETIDDIAPGTARRRAVEAALAELDAGRETPSPEWRRRYSLLLGLERLLTAQPVLLADGAELTEHQVDVLSGTLAALTTELEDSVAAESWNGAGLPAAEVDGDDPSPPATAELEGDGENGAAEEVAEEDETLAPDEEPKDWEEPAADMVAEAPEDAGASRRFWFEHATGSGKTVAALGFVEGSRTGGVLILTHRRNLVDQFIGEISDRGYKDRLSPPLMDGSDHPYGPVTV